AIEELAVVLADVGLPLADAAILPGPLGVAAVDVADGQEIAVARGAAGVAAALAAGADQAEPRPVVLGPGLVGQGPAEGREEREQRGAGRPDAEEIPAGVRADGHGGGFPGRRDATRPASPDRRRPGPRPRLFRPSLTGPGGGGNELPPPGRRRDGPGHTRSPLWLAG